MALAPSSQVSLLTDFGDQDGYVAAMKGVLSRIAPGVSVVDICHSIAPQDLQQAGIVWSAAAPYFPPGTIHVAVVDPGVGTGRRILAFESRGSVFLAPDNGLIGYVLPAAAIDRVVEVRRRRFFLPQVSATFHGRDIFAPVAAHLASGAATVKDLGPRTKRFLASRLPRPRRRRVEGGAQERGEIICVDRFGNLISNLRPRAGEKLAELHCAGFAARRLRRTYGSAPVGRALALVGSSGFVEVAVNGGSAARELGVGRGAPVTALWR